MISRSRIFYALLLIALALTGSGCDRIYALLHKPGGEERRILGAFTFNEYNVRVEYLQKILVAFAYTQSLPDGKFGASTREAVKSFQEDEGLEVTRFVDQQTWDRMQVYLDSGFFHGTDLDVKALQTALRKAGFPCGKVDGQLGPRTREAIRAFQAANGLEADGTPGLRTIRKLMAVTPAQ